MNRGRKYLNKNTQSIINKRQNLHWKKKKKDEMFKQSKLSVTLNKHLR